MVSFGFWSAAKARALALIGFLIRVEGYTAVALPSGRYLAGAGVGRDVPRDASPLFVMARDGELLFDSLEIE